MGLAERISECVGCVAWSLLSVRLEAERVLREWTDAERSKLGGSRHHVIERHRTSLSLLYRMERAPSPKPSETGAVAAVR